MSDLNRSISVYLDGSDLQRGAQQVQTAIDKLTGKLNQLKQAGDSTSAEFKKTESELKKNQTAMETYKNKVAATERVLKNLSGATLKELNAVSSALKKEIKGLERGTDTYRQKVELLNKVEQERKGALNDLNSAQGAHNSMFSRAAGGFNKYFGVVTAGLATITGLSFAFRKLAEDVAKMDDTYADVMKTTGMTKEQVVDLNESLKLMDTRTSREQLNLLARDAGKLGLSGKKDILDFVEAGNQINVALGEDLGEDAIKNIGKMVNVFQNSTKTLQNIDLKGQMLAVGSAINELGASSTASEPYLVAFAGRLGGVAKQAGISMDSILGFASSLDQDMQAVEMSATALQKFIMEMMGDPAKFAKLAGIEVKGFTKLLKEDANAAIKQVLRSLNEKGGFQELIPIFKDVGLDGARAVGVLSSMAGSINQIDEAQRVANKAMTEGVSVTNEYSIKNNTLAAQLDKAKKAFFEQSLILGESLSPVLLKSTKATTYLIKGLVEIIPWIKRNIGLILSIASAYAAYIIVQNAAIAVDKIKFFWNEKIIASFKRLYATMAANPWAALAVVLTIGIGLLIDYARKQNEITVSQRAMAEVNKKTAEQYDEQASKIEGLISVLNNEKISLTERKKALNEIKQLIPGYHASLTDEGKLINNNTDAIKDYLVQLEKEIRFKAVKDELSALYLEKRKQEKELLKVEKLNAELQTEWAPSSISKLKKEIIETNAAIADLGKEMESTSFSSPKETNTDNQKNPTQLGLSPEELKAQQDAAFQLLEKANQDVITSLKQRRLTELDVEIDFDKMMMAQKLAYLKTKLELEKKYAKDTNATQQQLADAEYQLLLELREAKERNDIQKILSRERDLGDVQANQVKIEDVAAKGVKHLKQLLEEDQKNKEAAHAKDVERQVEIAELYGGAIGQFGSMLGDFLTNQEMTTKEFAKSMILMALDVLEKQIIINVAAASASSLASTESVATWGIAGAAKAAIISGLIMAAFGGVKAAVSNSFAEGGFNYGESGGYTGNGGRYQVAGRLSNGATVHKSEYVIAAPELRNPRIMNAALAIESIRQQRTSVNATKGFAEGGFNTNYQAQDSSMLLAMFDKLSKKLDQPLNVYTEGRKSINDQAALIDKMKRNKSRNL